jgi:hypothetical protein
MTSGFESICPLAHLAVASYAVRVPRARSLPAASFGFRLAADTLAVRLGVPVIRASTGTFTRPVNSRFAFASRLQRQPMTLRVMPDAQKQTALGPKLVRGLFCFSAVRARLTVRFTLSCPAARGPGRQRGRHRCRNACTRLTPAPTRRSSSCPRIGRSGQDNDPSQIARPLRPQRGE